MTRLVVWIGVGALIALTVAAYLPIRSADFVLDDRVIVAENPIVERGDPREIFSTPYWAEGPVQTRDLYRPVTVLSYALVRAVVGHPSPLASHAVNLALHILTSLALILLARRLGVGPYASIAAGLLFAVHPVHVEAVAGVVGRADILAAMFSLLALWAWSHTGGWIRGAGEIMEPGPMHARAAAWTCGLLVFLALGSKESAVAVLPLLLVLDVLYRPPRRSRVARWLLERATALAPTALAVFAFLALRTRTLEALFALQRPHPVDNPLVLLDHPERIATALGLLARYTRILFFPIPLSIDYSGNAIPAEDGILAVRPLIGLTLLLALVALAALPWFRRFRTSRGEYVGPVCMAALLFLLPYLVIGNLLVPVGVIFAERFLYLPSVGFCLGAGVGLGYLAFRYPAFRHWSPEQRARYAGVAAVVLLAAFTLQTWARASVWQDDRSVFASAAAAYPGSARSFLILATLRSEDLPAGPLRPDDPAAAEILALYDRAIANAPVYVRAWLDSGLFLARTGRMDEAIERFEEAVRLSPGFATAHLDLGLALHRAGRLQEAERSLRKAIVHDRSSATAWADLGNVLAETDRPEEAVDAWKEAVRLGRTDLLRRIETVRQRR
jgi:cytochrome c-type biogenesis protein CcmH/NrfG